VGQRTGLFEAIDAVIPDPPNPVFVIHDQRSLIAPRIVAMALGSEDLNDHQTLRDDPALQLAAGRVPDGKLSRASPPTLCRLENRIGRQTLIRISEVLVDQFIASHAQPPEHLTLDFAATDDPVHGRQEGRFFHGYSDHYCYLPLYVFCGDELLTAYLRPSKSDASQHSRALLKLLVRRLRQAWPDVRSTLRADSGFGRWRLMRWCDCNGIGSVLELARNKALERLASDWINRAERQFQETSQPQRIFGSLAYQASSGDRQRRVIVKAEHTAQGPNPRFLVVNVPGDPQELYESVYCQRGDMENRIKEQQLDLFADRTSCHRFLANQFRLLLSSAAYVLVQALQRTALRETDLEKAQVGTIQLKLRKVAARVVVSARRVVFHLATSYAFADRFGAVFERVMSPVIPGRAGVGSRRRRPGGEQPRRVGVRGSCAH
jgi:hypothetical protein